MLPTGNSSRSKAKIHQPQSPKQQPTPFQNVQIKNQAPGSNPHLKQQSQQQHHSKQQPTPFQSGDNRQKYHQRSPPTKLSGADHQSVSSQVGGKKAAPGSADGGGRTIGYHQTTRKVSSGSNFYDSRRQAPQEGVHHPNLRRQNSNGGTCAPTQLTDSESPDTGSPFRRRNHKTSFHDLGGDEASSSSLSGPNDHVLNGHRRVSESRERKQSVGNWFVPDHILDDLCCRFIINIPEEERTNHVRIFFQIELAYWFYLDFYCQDDQSLKPLSMREFSRQIFNHCPTLSDYAANVDSILEEWREYKMAVPTYGGILLDETMTYILLAQGFWAKASWGFPKGKVNEDEPPVACAIREVYEETGFDITDLVDEDAFIERSISDQFTRLYIVKGVSLDTKFHPKTRKEIRSLEWFRVDNLPSHKKDLRCKEQVGIPPNSFFMVMPFVKEIRRWIRKKKNLVNSSSDDDQVTSLLGYSLTNHLDSREFKPTASHQKEANPFSPRSVQIIQSKTPHRRLDLDGGNAVSAAVSPPSQILSNLSSSSQSRSQRRDKRQTLDASVPVNHIELNLGQQRHSTAAVKLFDGSNDAGPHQSRHIRGRRLGDAELEETSRRPQREFPPCKAWENFQLDVNQVMACFAVVT